LIKRATQIAQH